MDIYDIIIVGAGPAGSTFARIADKNQKILLLNGKDKGNPCGGLLAPDAQKALAQFDLTLPKDVLVDPQIFSVKTIDLKSKLQQSYQRMYINVDREKFDEWLLSLVCENVTVKSAKCHKIVKENQGYNITYKNNQGVEEKAFCKVLIGADGANSIVRKSFFKKLSTRKYIAIQQWFKQEKQYANPFYSCIFDRETSDCCSWTISKDSYIIYGGAFALKNSKANFENQKQKLCDFGINLVNPIKTEACLVLRPKTFRSFECGANNIFLIGEAAGFISPSSLEGISSAIRSAVMLNESLKSKNKNKNIVYKKKAFLLKMKLVFKNLKCPFMYVPFLRKMVMKSGISSINIYE